MSGSRTLTGATISRSTATDTSTTAMMVKTTAVTGEALTYKQGAHRRAFGKSQKNGLSGTNVVHDGANVIHPFFER